LYAYNVLIVGLIHLAVIQSFGHSKFDERCVLQTFNSQVPFVFHINNLGFATFLEQLLYVRFHLQEMSLLVEREEFNEDGNLCCTVYKKPYVFDGGSYYKVWPNSYIVVGGVCPFDLFQAFTLSLGSVSSFLQRSRGHLMPTLPLVREVPKYTILSSFDNEDA
jgi:hypothetical protein